MLLKKTWQWLQLMGKANLSFSQEGEDRILARLFESKKSSGFYVDIGAHHPTRFSNTFLFYLSGWRGINVDPNPECMKGFLRKRPRDINLEFGVSSEDGMLKYHRFEEPALNTFNMQLASEREKNGLRMKSVIDVKVRPLSDIFKEYLPSDMGGVFEFLSIDVEGMELDVLASNNWTEFRPKIILAEELDDIDDLRKDSDIRVFLHNVGYQPFAKTLNTTFFCEHGDSGFI